MQYKTGTVTTDGTSTIEGSGTTWTGGNVSAGDIFTVVGDNAWYEVASVTDADTLVLTSAYAGANVSGATYAISRDFTSRLSLPYPQKGDIETASLIKRAFAQIDTNVAKANTSATTAPTTGDDTDDGYAVGSWWTDVTADEVYACVDATASAAVWLHLTTISEDTDMTFADNVKAIFGAGSDLQIYHTGAKSTIHDAGTGNLVVRANDFQITNAAETQNIIRGYDGGAAELYNTGNLKLATTSTGIDVTGTVTVGDSHTIGDDASDNLVITSSANEAIILNSGASIYARTASGTNRLSIDSTTGDISFYEDTGTTAKLFWDASAESLGIGTSSPNSKLHVYEGSSGEARVRIGNTDGEASLIANGDILYVLADTQVFKNQAGSSEYMHIDSSGNMGLGVTPESWAAGFTALQISSGGALWSNGNNVNLQSNSYYDGAYKYVNTDFASRYYQVSGKHTFYIAASGTADTAITWTTALTIENDGDVLVPNGNLVIGTSGKGIDFSADGNAAGMTSEVLDDYEEGTWTPYISGGVGTYTSRSGTYTKIGNIVSFRYNVSWSAHNNTGNIIIAGFPFNSGAAVNSYYAVQCSNISAGTGFVIQTARISPGAESGDLLRVENTGSGVAVTIPADASGTIEGFGTYEV